MSRKVAIMLIILAALGVPAGLAAQEEPFLGIWELNLVDGYRAKNGKQRG